MTDLNPKREEEFPDMDNLTEEDKKKWFTVEEFRGYKFLKVKPEMFTPPKVEGPAIFHSQLEKLSTKGKMEPTIKMFTKNDVVVYEGPITEDSLSYIRMFDEEDFDGAVVKVIHTFDINIEPTDMEHVMLDKLRECDFTAFDEKEGVIIWTMD